MPPEPAIRSRSGDEAVDVLDTRVEDIPDARRTVGKQCASAGTPYAAADDEQRAGRRPPTKLDGGCQRIVRLTRSMHDDHHVMVVRAAFRAMA
jgi:hypothetical protein